MARHIDADRVMEEIASMGGHNLCEWSTLGVKALIDRQPTADVAPRAEVAREIFWEIDKLLARIITDDEAGTQFIGVDMQKYYALKMKYTATTDEPPKGD